MNIGDFKVMHVESKNTRKKGVEMKHITICLSGDELAELKTVADDEAVSVAAVIRASERFSEFPETRKVRKTFFCHLLVDCLIGRLRERPRGATEKGVSKLNAYP